LSPQFFAELPQVLVTGITVGCFYALIATALQITYGATRILNFAQGEFAVGGMFLLWLFTASLRIDLWLSLLFVVVAGFALGVVFELAAIRPFGSRAPLTAALATFAGGIALRGLYSIVFGPESRGMPRFVEVGPFHIYRCGRSFGLGVRVWLSAADLDRSRDDSKCGEP
jgi:branched-chain amino acid transport system permease protein